MSKPNPLAEIPEPIEPEYKTWSLERLQSEYFILSLKYTSQEIVNAEENDRVKKAERLIESIKDCLEG